jgi:circadian clock protein KaiC
MTSEKVGTGIQGLDVMLEGGFPKGRVILLMGGPGTGKTILCSQFLHWGATRKDDKAIYISLDETKSQYSREMLAFGWDFAQLDNESKFAFVDGSGVIRTPEQAKLGRIPVGGRELGLVSLLDMIESSVEKIGARRVVLDSIAGLIFRFPRVEERRLAVMDIMQDLNATGSTCLVTSEVLSWGKRRLVQPEEYLAHGVIDLQILPNGVRQIQILKMRETKIDTTPRPYGISETGIEVSPDEYVYAPEKP